MHTNEASPQTDKHVGESSAEARTDCAHEMGSGSTTALKWGRLKANRLPSRRPPPEPKRERNTERGVGF